MYTAAPSPILQAPFSNKCHRANRASLWLLERQEICAQYHCQTVSQLKCNGLQVAMWYSGQKSQAWACSAIAHQVILPWCFLLSKSDPSYPQRVSRFLSFVWMNL